MPQLYAPFSTKQVPFLYDQVTGTFAASFSYNATWEADGLEARLLKALGKESDGVVTAYAEALTYTENLAFNWNADAPDDWRNLEAFWRMVKEGKDELECFKFFSRLDSRILAGTKRQRKGDPELRGWQQAFLAATELYTPAETKPEDKLTDEELNDPN